MRKSKPKQRLLLPDPVYSDTLVTRFVNSLMNDGKKNVAYKVFYGAMDILAEKNKDGEKERWENLNFQTGMKILGWSAGHFILGLELFLKHFDFPGLLIDGSFPRGLKGCRSIFKELSLPPVKDRRLQMVLITEIRYRNSIDQVPFENSDLLFWPVILSLFFH